MAKTLVQPAVKDPGQPCLQYTLDDLQSYVDSEKPHADHEVTNMLMLGSELYLEGLRSLHNFLKSEEDPSRVVTVDQFYADNTSIAEVREQCAIGLLHDLENLTKRHEFNKQLFKSIKDPQSGKIVDVAIQKPSFNKDTFYDEILKPQNERSKELQAFLEYCKNLPDNSPPITVNETISAKMLLKLDELELENSLRAKLQQELNTTEGLRTELYQELKQNKGKFKTQTEKDIGKDNVPIRNPVFLKMPNGKTEIITPGKLAQLVNDKILTGEQAEFIAQRWHQGTFACGWLTTGSHVPEKAQDPNGLGDFTENTWLLVDISQQPEGIIKVYNRTSFKIKDSETGNITPYVEGVLTMDISGLNGTEYIPGCATNKPKITVMISEFDKNTEYSLPENMPRQKGNDTIRLGLISSSISANLNELLINGPAAKLAITSLGKGKENAAVIFDNIINSELDISAKLKIMDNIKTTLKQPKFFDKTIAMHAAVLNLDRDKRKLSPQQQNLKQGIKSFEKLGKTIAALTAQKLNDYCATQTTTPPDKEQIQKNIIAILGLICNAEETRTLIIRTEAIVEELTILDNKTFAEKWQAKAGNNPIRMLLEPENKIAKVLQGQGELITRVKKSLTSPPRPKVIIGRTN